MKVLRKISTILLLVIAILFFDILCAIVLSFIQQLLFVPKSYLICTFDSPEKYLVFVLLLIVDVFVYLLWRRLFDKDSRPNRFKKKYWSIVAVFIVLTLYMQITSISVFTDKEIIRHSFYHPFAEEYTYKDIVSVDTGAYGDYIPHIRQKGDFYYIIRFKDGTTINLMDIGDESSDDTYSQVEHIDKIVMSYGAKKVSSENNIQFSNLDKIYIDRFKRIIENK